MVASGEEGKSVCEIAEAPASFKSDKARHFGFFSVEK